MTDTLERIWIDSKGIYPYFYKKEPSDSVFPVTEYIRADLFHRPEPEVRGQALEEAAKLCDRIGAWDIADDIRELKSQPAPDGWQPIGVSTPRDRVILAWGNNWHWEGIEKAYLHSDYNGHKNVICRGGMAGEPFTLGRQDAPTHWHPLPSAPTSEVGK